MHLLLYFQATSSFESQAPLPRFRAASAYFFSPCLGSHGAPFYYPSRPDLAFKANECPLPRSPPMCAHLSHTSSQRAGFPCSFTLRLLVGLPPRDSNEIRNAFVRFAIFFPSRVRPGFKIISLSSPFVYMSLASPPLRQPGLVFPLLC